MLKTQKNQILYPHFRKPHFWNLQPFQGIVNGTSQNWQPFQGRRISRMPKTTTVKHHGPDNQGLFPCLPAFCKKAASSNKHHNPWICWRCHAKKIWPHRCLKTVQKLLCSRFLTYDAWVYCPSSWCKLGRRTLVSAVAKTWPPNRWPEPLNKVTRWTIWCHASHGKSPQAVRNRKAPSWGHLAMTQKWFTP